MATLKLKKPAAPGTAPARADRPPARGAASPPRKRPTLAEAQNQRAEREARYQEQLRQRFGDKPPPKAFVRREEPDAQGAPRGRRPDAPPPAPPRRAAGGSSNSAFEPRRDRPPQQDRDRRDAPPPARPSIRNADAPVPPRPRVDQRRARASAPARHHDAREYEHEPDHPEIPGSMRLSKRMSELGIASRREADEWIAKSWVRVDGRIVNELGSRVVPGQHITVDAKARFQQAQRVTILVNKPVGYVSGQAEDGYEPAVVLVTPENQWREDRSGTRFLREHLRGLAPAGRLDIDSIGLLVLTQDGRIAKQLIGEDTDIEKEYLVRVELPGGGLLSDEALALLNHGLELDGEPLLPALVEWINANQLRFVLKEGKKRQIRRMCEAVGLTVLGLKRVRIGGVALGDLPLGHWRYLRADERFG